MRLSPASARVRRAGLTPMIDVIFLLLFFFMLASKIGPDAGISLEAAGGAGGWTGAPRLVDVMPQGVSLNGVATREADLATALLDLMESSGDPVVLRARADASLGRLVEVIDALRRSGLDRILIVE